MVSRRRRPTRDRFEARFRYYDVPESCGGSGGSACEGENKKYTFASSAQKDQKQKQLAIINQLSMRDDLELCS